MSEFITQLQSTSLLEWMASLFALIYIYLAYKNLPLCFVFGLLSSVLWAYYSYQILNLKFDGSLQVFYGLMSFYGLYIWKYGGDNNSTKPISYLSLKQNLIWIFGGFIVVLLIYLWAERFIESSRTFLDIFTTVYSIIGTFLLVYRKIENWIIFIIADLLYIYIYYSQGAYVFVMMMMIYILIAIPSWFNWKRIYLESV